MLETASKATGKVCRDNMLSGESAKSPQDLRALARRRYARRSRRSRFTTPGVVCGRKTDVLSVRRGREYHGEIDGKNAWRAADIQQLLLSDFQNVLLRFTLGSPTLTYSCRVVGFTRKLFCHKVFFWCCLAGTMLRNGGKETILLHFARMQFLCQAIISK